MLSPKKRELFLFHEGEEEKKNKDEGVFHSGIPVNLLRRSDFLANPAVLRENESII